MSACPVSRLIAAGSSPIAAEFVTVKLGALDMLASDDEYTGRRSYRVAETYRKEVADAKDEARPPRPKVAIADEFAVSESVASKYIAQARREGYLPPAQHGRVTV